jgi:hypothetical protein
MGRAACRAHCARLRCHADLSVGIDELNALPGSTHRHFGRVSATAQQITGMGHSGRPLSLLRMSPLRPERVPRGCEITAFRRDQPCLVFAWGRMSDIGAHQWCWPPLQALLIIARVLPRRGCGANIDGRPASRHLCFSSRCDPDPPLARGGVIQRLDNNRMRHDCGLVAIR